MLLAVDIGNTNIVLGIFEGEDLTQSWRLATLQERTADELRVLVGRLFEERHLDMTGVSGVVLASVVPPLTSTVTEMVRGAFGRETLAIDATNVGLPIEYQAPGDVGADRLVNAVAALDEFGGGARPIIVVDFGTATTFDVISAEGTYIGGVICPGVEISADALFQRAARLPRVDIGRPEQLIGTSTVGSMRSGLFFGYVAMVEGIVARPGETGSIDHVSPNLTLHGLRLAWNRNETTREGGAGTPAS